ncbi:kinase-like protein [Rickenella mellea]|uniref:Kinase-like protein n=1 Tax=Rickenella mellea TaxID=50990 RepID=A0A4Y7PR98_9AGAM|nr:kinase-like protein [Rickenella mellea]
MQCQSQFAQTLARLAKSTACYPDSLILGSVCRIGKDPMAGGGFADVWKGRFGEKTVALKAFRIFQKKPQEKAFNALSHEAVIWRQLKHPNILPFYGVFKGDEDFDRLCLVSPWMDAGNIMEYIDRRTDCNRITLLADVSSGLEYLHNFKPAVIHGDLKGANILVNPFTVACLADFGLARFRSSEESSCSATTGNSGAGTLRWQAPELFSPREGKSSQVCQETDVYSFGCVCIEVMTGKIPFAEIRQDPAFVIAIMNQQKPQRPNEDLLERGLDDSLWATMMQCWDADPSLRPSALQLVQYFEHRKDLEPRDSRKFECFELPETLRTSLGQYGFPDDFVAKVSGEQVLV